MTQYFFMSAKNVSNLVGNLNYNLSFFSRWLKYKKLKLNMSKTKMLNFSNILLDAQPKIITDGEIIAVASAMKYLGVTVDDRLRF